MATSMPVVSSCEVQSCFYNSGKMCHAPAINVGSDHAACDAFVADGRGRHSARSDVGLVGACHIEDCRFNSDMTCGAPGIVVLGHAGHADCGTYQHR